MKRQNQVKEIDSIIREKKTKPEKKLISCRTSIFFASKPKFLRDLVKNVEKRKLEPVLV